MTFKISVESLLLKHLRKMHQQTTNFIVSSVSVCFRFDSLFEENNYHFRLFLGVKDVSFVKFAYFIGVYFLFFDFV